MMMRFITLIIYFAAALQPVYGNQKLQPAHAGLFEYFFPAIGLPPELLEARSQLKEATWQFVQSQKIILDLLQPFSPECFFLLPPDVQENFPELSSTLLSELGEERMQELLTYLQRHSSNDIRRLAFNIKKVYLSLAYFSPLTEQISQISEENVKAKPSRFALPKTKLVRKENKVIHTRGTIDYLIIGSGPAGALIAHEISRIRKDARVLIVEAGPFVRPGTVDTAFAPQLMESANLRTNTTGDIILRTARAVGGGTAVNVDLAFSPQLPSIRHRLDTWIKNGWVSKDLFNSNRIETTYAWLKKQIGTRTVDILDTNKNNRILGFGAIEQKIKPSLYDLNAKAPEAGKSLKEQILKISAVDAFLAKALLGKHGAPSISIIPDAKVVKINMHRFAGTTKARSVTLEMQAGWDAPFVIKDPNDFSFNVGDQFTIEARNIIVSGGSLGSPETLLKSDLQNPNIGKGVVLHPAFGFPSRFPQKVDILDGISAAVYVPAPKIKDGFFFESMAATPSFAALIHPGNGRQILEMVKNADYYGGFGVMVLDEPETHNKVFLDENGKVQVAYTMSEDTKEKLRRGTKVGLKMILSTYAMEVNLPTSEPIISDSFDYKPITSFDQVESAIDKLQFIPNQNFITSAHIQGSNKMGKDPQSSVVSHNFRVWDYPNRKEISNLYVVDSSIFPTSCGANPMQTVYTTAKIFVDGVLQQRNLIP